MILIAYPNFKIKIVTYNTCSKMFRNGYRKSEWIHDWHSSLRKYKKKSNISELDRWKLDVFRYCVHVQPVGNFILTLQLYEWTFNPIMVHLPYPQFYTLVMYIGNYLYSFLMIFFLHIHRSCFCSENDSLLNNIGIVSTWIQWSINGRFVFLCLNEKIR